VCTHPVPAAALVHVAIGAHHETAEGRGQEAPSGVRGAPPPIFCHCALEPSSPSFEDADTLSLFCPPQFHSHTKCHPRNSPVMLEPSLSIEHAHFKPTPRSPLQLVLKFISCSVHSLFLL
jgi:hypothetical protein